MTFVLGWALKNQMSFNCIVLYLYLYLSIHPSIHPSIYLSILFLRGWVEESLEGTYTSPVSAQDQGLDLISLGERVGRAIGDKKTNDKTEP